MNGPTTPHTEKNIRLMGWSQCVFCKGVVGLNLSVQKDPKENTLESKWMAQQLEGKLVKGPL